MKNSLLIVMLISSAGLLRAQDQIIRDADAEVRNVKGFQAIEVSNAIDLQISQGADAVAVSAGSDEYRNAIRTEVSGGVLRIFVEGKNGIRNRGRARVYVSARELNKISVSGACDVSINGEFKTGDLSVRLSGASDLRGRLVASSLKLDLSGASDLDLKGSTTDLNVEASGASHIKGYDFSVANCKIQASGASDIELTITKLLNASASGAANIYFKGDGRIGDIRTSGASHVARR